MKKLKRSKNARPYVFVGAFIAIGLLLLFIVRAATPTVNFEAEAGSRSGSAASLADSTASGGQYLKFGSVATTPPPSNGNCTGNPNGTFVRANFPCNANTGPTKATTTTHNGTLTISQPGKVIDGYTINGNVIVNATGVIIRNSIITGQGIFIIDNTNGKGLIVEDSIVRGTGTRPNAEFGSPCEAVVGPGDYTVRRSEISGCEDGFKVQGRVEIVNSYIHDNYTHRLGNGDGTHNDTVQMRGTTLTHLVFSGNAAYEDSCTSNRHFQLAPTQTPTPGGYLRIENNFFYGIKVINVDRGLRFSDGRFANNTMAGSSARGPFSGAPSAHIYSGDGMGTVGKSGNVWEQGGSANDNPASGYTCVGG